MVPTVIVFMSETECLVIFGISIIEPSLDLFNWHAVKDKDSQSHTQKVESKINTSKKNLNGKSLFYLEYIGISNLNPIATKR